LSTADEIAERASRGEDVSAYFANKFTVVRPTRLNISRQAVIKILLAWALHEEHASGPRPSTWGEVRSHFLHDVVIRMHPGVRLQEAQVRRAIAGVDPNLPVVRMQSLSEQVAGNFGQQRLIARLTSLFGILAGSGFDRTIRRHCV
jgi:hypothetical protein